MKVLLVCKLNKARSIFGAAILNSIYPLLEVHSAGIAAIDNSPVSKEVLEVAKKWNLQGLKVFSENIENFRTDLGNFELIIAADVEVHSWLKEHALEFNSTCFADSALDKDFCPLDPISMSRQKMEIELAKVAHSVIRVVDQKLHASRMHPIKVFIPISQSDSELAFNFALLEHRNLGGFLVDADFRAPYFASKREEIPVKNFDLFEQKQEIYQVFEVGDILAPAREFSNPESILVSTSWITFVIDLAKLAPVVILTAPRFVNKNEFADSYLASSLATSVTTIGA